MPKQRKIVPKRTKKDKKTYIVISILGTTSGGGAEKDNCSAETEKIQSAEKSAETGGNREYKKIKNFVFCIITLTEESSIISKTGVVDISWDL